MSKLHMAVLANINLDTRALSYRPLIYLFHQAVFQSFYILFYYRETMYYSVTMIP